MESLRLAPPAALIARETTKALSLDGVQVASGTEVWLPAVWLHQDDLSWERAKEFDPSRWLQKVCVCVCMYVHVVQLQRGACACVRAAELQCVCLCVVCL